MDGGVALVLYWSFENFDAATKSVNVTRGGGGNSSGNMDGFETSLEGSRFCLRSEDEDGIVTVPLKRVGHAQGGYVPLPKVSADWQKILSPHAFEIENESDHAKLNERADWTLQLEHTPESEVYRTQQALFPQTWLSRLTDQWLSTNKTEWNWENKDCFGIPTADSLRTGALCEPGEARKHFTFISIPNDSNTAMGEGSQAIAVSNKQLVTEYSTSTAKYKNFPARGQIYVIPINLPTTYRIGRELTEDSAWECVLCFENGAQGDGGVYFGACGHYICGGCCKEPGFMDRLNAAKSCYCCRRPARIKLKHGDCFPPSQKQVKMQADCHGDLDMSVAKQYNGTDTHPVQWAIQLYSKTEKSGWYDISREQAHFESPSRLRYQIEAALHYVVSIWNISEQAIGAQSAVYSIWFTGDNYAISEQEPDRIELDPSDRFCTVQIRMDVGEDLNAWIIKDAHGIEVLSIEFECVDEATKQAQSASSVDYMLLQLKCVLDA
jgi:hypothetical protein